MNVQTKAQNFDELDSVCVRFAGDSGDGMQLTGDQFSVVTALEGSDLSTFPDFPAEIRAPVGTTFGVSATTMPAGRGSKKPTPSSGPSV